MTFRGATNFNGNVRKLPMRMSYSRHKPFGGLDQNTVLEGSSIDTYKDSKSSAKSSRERRSSNENTDSNNWKEKYFNLQKIVQNLRKEIKIKDNLIHDLEKQKETQKDEYVQRIEKLESSLEQKQFLFDEEIAKLKIQNEKVAEESKIYQKKVTEYSEQIENEKRLHSETLSTMLQEHIKEIKKSEENNQIKINDMEKKHNEMVKEKDLIIVKLKAQVADSLKTSSKERQSQIDELVKELKRVSDEAEYVKSALRKFKSLSTDNCSRCNMYQEKFKEITLELSKKNSICQNLFLVCSRMEKQLQQKKDLLHIWNTVKSEK